MNLTRRQFCLGVGASMVLPVFGFTARAATINYKGVPMPFTLPPLPYDKAALEPHISARTLEFHHGKHHKAYVDKTNELIAGTPFENKSLEEIIVATGKEEPKKPLFNNAAQVWNHTFFWHCLTPKNGGGEPKGKLAEQINKDFGSYAKFAEEFSEAAKTQFGSGWAWLVLKDGKLSVSKSPNAVNPLPNGEIPILTLDVWEHAYYLDYQNRRPDFVKTFLDSLANWEFAAKNFESQSVFKAAA